MPSPVERSYRWGSEGQHEFRISYDGEVVGEEDVRALLAALEERCSGDDPPADGSTIQIGWVVTRVRGNEDGTLSLFEPDMTHSPIWWVESINHSLIHLRLQRQVCASVVGADEVAFPSTLDSALFCDRFGDTEGLVMQRNEGGEGDSGWLFGCDDPKHPHDDSSTVHRIQLYEVAVSYEPRVIPYLALPPGLEVRLGPGGPAISRAGQPLPFTAGSVLATNFPAADG